MKWLFNVGDGDHIIVDAPSLSKAAAAVEKDWAGMVNAVVSEEYQERTLASFAKRQAILAAFDDGTDPSVDIGAILREGTGE